MITFGAGCGDDDDGTGPVPDAGGPDIDGGPATDSGVGDDDGSVPEEDAGPTCVANGGACATGGECCSGTCEGGTCMDEFVFAGQPLDGDCGADDECNSGNCAISTACVLPEGECKSAPTECDFHWECCDGRCNSGICVLPPLTCRVNGGDCDTNGQCCSGDCDASGGTCDPARVGLRLSDGDACATDSQCLSGDCQRGVCVAATCVPAGFACSEEMGFRCCGGQCNADGTCLGPVACIEDHQLCSESWECCSDLCNPASGRCEPSP